MSGHFENLDTENRRQMDAGDTVPDYLKDLADRHGLTFEQILILTEHLPEFESAEDCEMTLESFLTFAF
jgi:hypothetical protein